MMPKVYFSARQVLDALNLPPGSWWIAVKMKRRCEMPGCHRNSDCKVRVVMGGSGSSSLINVSLCSDCADPILSDKLGEMDDRGWHHRKVTTE